MELSPPRMTDEEIIETLKEFVFGNFDVSKKVREAIDEVIVRMETKSDLLCKRRIE